MTDLLKDFKSGPLDVYRKKASFDWKKLKIFLDTEEGVKYEIEFYNELEKYKEFKNHDSIHGISFDEERRLALHQCFAYKSIRLHSLEYQLGNLIFPSISNRIATQFLPSAAIKYNVSITLFVNAIRSLGTERHYHFLDDIEMGKITGCYCLTEIGHGSNAKGMRTTASYNKEKKVFILHSENFEAAKCWAGGLGQTASHALVYAQLITGERKYGLHCFVVPIRDPKSLLPFPGIIVGDMGEKIGLNGVDNGFLLFNNYEIPRENLLNKLGDVSEDGQYITPYKDPNKRHGAALGSLSGGRVYITGMCEAYTTHALTIAIRYAGIRKQFGPNELTEVPLLEYQTHQYRLLPYLAAAYILRIFSPWLITVLYQFSIDAIMGNDKELQAQQGLELHAVSSASKPVAGWIAKQAIQECREACGGHGYLKASRIGDIRNNNDANLTYEGENHILIQQTSNWLLKFWPLILNKKEISSPLKSVNFLGDSLNILQKNKFSATCIEEMRSPDNIISTYQWLVAYLLRKTHTNLENSMKSKDTFWAKNENQVFNAKNLSVAFIEHFMLQVTLSKIKEASEESVKNVLLKLFSLFGLWSLEKHVASLYAGEYVSGPQFVTLLENSILRLCSDLKDEAIALIDVIAPPDVVINSVLGASDGEVYKHLQSALFSSPYAMSRPSWWQEIISLRENTVQSKL